MKFHGSIVHSQDLRDAKVGQAYFIVREKLHSTHHVGGGGERARLQSLTPERLGSVSGLEEGSPVVERDLLGVARLLSVGKLLVLEPLTGTEEKAFRRRAAERLAQQKSREEYIS